MLSLVTPPATEPITLAEAKVQARVEVADEDALITSYITAARLWAEAFTGRAFITQTWALKLDRFPWSTASPIWLPKPPLIAVDSIQYLDDGGVTQTWDPLKYLVDKPTGPHAWKGRITPAYQEIYPIIRWVMNAVTVQFQAGYGAVTAVPELIKSALKMLVAELFERREASIAGTIITAVPMGVEALLYPFRVEPV